jgi:hypothetical protein
MRAKIMLIGAVLATLILAVMLFLRLSAAAVTSTGRTMGESTSTLPPAPTDPPTGDTPIPSPTLWLDAPHREYVQPVLKQEATATPTQAPGTPTPPPVPTDPSDGVTATPSPTLWLDAPHNEYVQPVLKQEATPTPTQAPGTPTPPPIPTDPRP